MIFPKSIPSGYIKKFFDTSISLGLTNIEIKRQ